MTGPAAACVNALVQGAGGGRPRGVNVALIQGHGSPSVPTRNQSADRGCRASVERILIQMEDVCRLVPFGQSGLVGGLKVSGIVGQEVGTEVRIARPILWESASVMITSVAYHTSSRHELLSTAVEVYRGQELSAGAENQES